MPPKQPSDSLLSAPGSSVPLLVRMPDGKHHQVDVAPNSSIKDLKSSIAANLGSWTSYVPNASGPGSTEPSPSDSAAGFELDFGGNILKESATIGDYNIPDTYDHAYGLLRTITESTHTDAGKKVEALDKACAVVQGISRGEKDMEKLISAVFDEDDLPNDDTAQPALRDVKRRGRSKIPPLNFDDLSPLAPLGGNGKNAPPTPSQLLRRLSTTRPDLYDPGVADKVDGATADLQRQSSWFTQAVKLGTDGASDLGTSNPQPVDTSLNGTSNDAIAPGSGELKRGPTWFSNIINALDNSVSTPRMVKDENVDGDSEGEIDADSEGEEPSSGAQINGSDIATLGMRVKNEPQSAKSLQPGQSASLKHGQDPNGQKRSDVAGDTSAAKPLPAGMNSVAVPADNEKSSKGSVPTDSSKVGATAPSQPTGNLSTSETSIDLKSTPAENASSIADGSEKKPSTLPSDSQKQVIGLAPEQSSAMDDVKRPKKRGRKRKNPHLTDEERKAQRQAQNRESAKLSRIRRKHMTLEYERRVTSLEGENENLRDTVQALTDRLEILQNLLTISVQKRPIPPQALQQQLHGVQSAQPFNGLGGLNPALNPAVNPTVGLNTPPGLNVSTGLTMAPGNINPATGLPTSLGLNPTSSIPMTVPKPTTLNSQGALNAQASQAQHLANLNNMRYKNF